jgi:chromate transport protein ChrA
MTLVMLMIIVLLNRYQNNWQYLTIGVTSMLVTILLTAGWRFPGWSVVAFRDNCEQRYRGRALGS